MRNLIIMLIIVSATYPLTAQSDPFQIHLEPVTIESLPGLQAYVWGQHDGKWLVLGGRIDGLHRRQPWATFNPDGRHTNIIVVDPVNGKTWTAPLTAAPASRCALHQTQVGNRLFLAIAR